MVVCAWNPSIWKCEEGTRFQVILAYAVAAWASWDLHLYCFQVLEVVGISPIILFMVVFS